jgi:hypothetical protein
MSFCPYTTVFHCNDISSLLNISREEIFELHQKGVLQFGGWIENIAGGAIALPNAFDLLGVYTFVHLIRQGYGHSESKIFSAYFADTFADFLTVRGGGNFTEHEYKEQAISKEFYRYFSNDFAKSQTNRDLFSMLSLHFIRFWGKIHMYCYSRHNLPRDFSSTLDYHPFAA